MPQTIDNAITLGGAAVDVTTLAAELRTAGVPAVACGISGDLLWMYDATSEVLDPTPAAEAVVAAHVAPPRVIDFAAAQDTDVILRTTDGAPHELLRFPLAPTTGYDCELKVMGVDAGNGAVKKLKVDATIKRLNAGPVAVGAPTTTVTHQDASASAWTVALTFSGSDALISVTGAAGRSIDWICRTHIARFAPGGLEG